VDEERVLRAFGTRLRQLRRQRGMTQADLSRATGLDRTYISGVETGRRNVSLLAITTLAEGLGVHPSWLFKD
jgi:transcriptional regulator with XRE-family HTH domain